MCRCVTPWKLSVRRAGLCGCKIVHQMPRLQPLQHPHQRGGRPGYDPAQGILLLQMRQAAEPAHRPIHSPVPPPYRQSAGGIFKCGHIPWHGAAQDFAVFLRERRLGLSEFWPEAFCGNHAIAHCQYGAASKILKWFSIFLSLKAIQIDAKKGVLRNQAPLTEGFDNKWCHWQKRT